MRPILITVSLFVMVRKAEISVESAAGLNSYKIPRLFSNPFGFLGNDMCSARLDTGFNATGFCYNEMECLLR